MELVSILLKLAAIVAFLGFVVFVVALFWPEASNKEIFGDYIPKRLIEFARCCFIVVAFCLLIVLIIEAFTVKVE